MSFEERKRLLLAFVESFDPSAPDAELDERAVDAFLHSSPEGRRLTEEDRLDGLHLDGLIDAIEHLSSSRTPKMGYRDMGPTLETLRRLRARLWGPVTLELSPFEETKPQRVATPIRPEAPGDATAPAVAVITTPRHGTMVEFEPLVPGALIDDALKVHRLMEPDYPRPETVLAVRCLSVALCNAINARLGAMFPARHEGESA